MVELSLKTRVGVRVVALRFVWALKASSEEFSGHVQVLVNKG